MQQEDFGNSFLRFSKKTGVGAIEDMHNKNTLVIGNTLSELTVHAPRETYGLGLLLIEQLMAKIGWELKIHQRKDLFFVSMELDNQTESNCSHP